MTSEADDELRRYYATLAPGYDDTRRHPTDAAPENEYIRALIPPMFSGRRVIDAACGTGSWTERISRHATEIVGVDVNPGVLDVARQRPGLGNARLVEGDVYALSDTLGTFDAAFVGFWFSHVPRARVAAFLGSLHRRLEPGALVVMVDNAVAHARSTPIRERDTDGNGFQIRQLADGSSFRVLKNFPSEADLTAATAPFGTNQQFRELEWFWIFTYETRATG